MTIGSEHRPNKRITSTLQKQINKKILKEQSEPQTNTLIVKKHYVLVYESHLLQRNIENVHVLKLGLFRELSLTIHGRAPTSSPISTENDGSPRLFLKYNYRTKFPCKNNHNTDPCLPANDQKMVCQTLVFILPTNYIFNAA